MTAADRAEEMHRARVYLSEARSRRDSPVNRTFYWRLMNWAANCRGRIIASDQIAVAGPAQRDLFA